MKRKISFAFIFIFAICSSCVFGVDTSSLDISSPACIMVEETTETIIYEKNSNDKMYPASTTKILTALLTLEKGNLDDVVTISHSAIEDLKGGYITPYISEGEELTVEQLLNVLLVPSGNVAGNALAEYVSGSTQNFANLMNTRAKELGCTNSNFTNSYGKHDDNHYTSAHDLYLITRAAMKYDIFRQIVSQTSYTLPATNKHSKNDRILTSTNDLIKPSSSVYYEGAIGIKTGFTTPAKDCLVAAATKNNMTFYVVILGADKNKSNVSYRYIDCKKLFDFAFKNYAFRTIISKDFVVKTIEIQGATSSTKKLDLIADSKISALITNADTYTSFIPTITINELSAPINKGEIVGSITYEIDGKTYTANLLAGSDVKKSYMFILVDIFIAIAILIIIRIIFFKKKRKKRIKKYRI